MSAARPWPERLGLHRPELRAWALYDWANSAFMTTVVAAVYPIYFSRVAASGLEPAQATTVFAASTTAALAVSAVLSPLLGALADYRGLKKPLLTGFMLLGAASTAALGLVGPGDWKLGAGLFVLANIGATASFVFYDSLLPHIASSDEMDRVSSAGYALGYLGGGLLLAVNLAWIQKPELFGLADAGQATRLSFVSVGLWWALFTVPLLLRVPEPPRKLEEDETPGQNALVVTFVRLGETLKELRGYKQAFLMLLAFMIYNDGISTIIRMATTYGAEIGLDQGHMIQALLLVQFVGIPFAFLFGMLAGRIGAKKAIFLSLAVYTAISALAFKMQTSAEFYLLAVLVGMVQGGSQALSRSMFAAMIPKHKSSEFFGFFGVFEKFAGVAGPALFALAVYGTGSSRLAILSVTVFFAVGAALLRKVDLEEGRRQAAAHDRHLH